MLLQLLSAVRDRRWALALGLLFAIAEHGLAVAAAGVMGWMVGVAASRVTSVSESALGSAAGVLAALVLGSAISAWQCSHFSHVFAYRHQAALRLRLFDGLERSAPKHLLGQRTGDLGATVMGDVEELESFFAHLAVLVIMAIVVGTGAVVFLACIHPYLAGLAASGFLLASFVPGWLAVRVQTMGEAVRAELGALNADVVDGIQGMRELVLFQGLDAFAARLAERTQRHEHLQRRLARASGLQQGMTNALASLTSLTILLVAVHLSEKGTISFSAATMAVAVAGAALTSVHEAIGIAGGLAPLRASAKRVLTVLEQPPAVHVTTAANDMKPGAPSGVRFDEVRFSYEPHKEILRGVSFGVDPGEMVALVGASGAGKSTCIHLLLRFWDVTGGAISIGGRDVRSLPPEELRRLVAVIPQDVYLFHGTVRDNVRLGNPDASEAQVQAALVAANAHEFVARLPHGIETMVGERGALLSGGQRQRLAIARALLMDAPVLVLDEAASALDAANEEAIQSALRTARRGRATLVIAHRPSTIRSADRVVVLREGIARGPHGLEEPA